MWKELFGFGFNKETGGGENVIETDYKITLHDTKSMTLFSRGRWVLFFYTSFVVEKIFL